MKQTYFQVWQFQSRTGGEADSEEGVHLPNAGEDPLHARECQ